MRHHFLALMCILAALVATGIAGASTGSVHYWVKHSGVTCGFGTGPQGRGVACMRNSQKGYAVTLTSTRVIVWLDGKKIFSRSQH